MSVLERDSIVRDFSNDILNNYIAISGQIHVEGRTDEMRTSPIRRTFCLIVLFDLVLCVLVWILRIQISHSKITFVSEVLYYKFDASLFDTVVLAALRFIFLEVMYGGVKSKLPWWMALSTAASSVFVIIKMFMAYMQPEKESRQDPTLIDYITILLTFVLCWVETIFMVCRMLPKERAAEQVSAYHRALSEQFATSTPSLVSYAPTSEPENRLSPNLSTDDEFYSPRDTRPGSPTQIRIKEMQHLAKDLQERAWELVRNGSGWTYMTGDAIQGCVSYKELISYKGKVFKIETLLNVAAECLYFDMIENCEQSPNWNPHARVVRKVENINNNIDILYNLSNEALKGYISPRDFVLLRTWAVVGNSYLISMGSIAHKEYPPQENIVRGDYGLGTICLQSNIDDVNQCRCIWIMNSDIKGKVFRSMVDRAMPGIMLEIIAGLRQHSTTLRRST